MTFQEAHDADPSGSVEIEPSARALDAGRSRQGPPTAENADPEPASILDDWTLWQRARGLSEKTITERVRVIRRYSNAAELTAVDIDQFLADPALARSSRATYHGAIRAWHR